MSIEQSIKLDSLTKSVFDGLLVAYRNHKKLGEDGKAKDKENRFGDMALRADVEAEECLTNSLKKFAIKNDIRIVCKSEELGEQYINLKGIDTYFAVFDGLDGSKNFLENGKFGYGTMIAVAKKENPNYEDFFVAGEAMMEEGKIILAIKNVGVLIYDILDEKFSKLPIFDKDEIFDDEKMLANKYFPEEINAYGNTSWIMTNSTAWSIFSICTNSRYNGLIEVTRKGNLEQPILYLMINTLGGVMVDRKGKSISGYTFLEWGQMKDGEEFLITAKNMGIVRQVLTKVNI